MNKVTKAAKAKLKNAQTKITTASLYTWNRWLALLHAAQGVAVLLLATAATFPVTTSYLTLDTLASEAAGNPVLAVATRELFSVNVAYLIAAFFFMSAAAHASLAWWCRKWYDENLKKGINKARWFEYAASASTMLVAIALLTGIGDLASLVMIFVLSAIMNLMGLAMEVYNQGKAKPNWLAYRVGVLAGIVPWIVLAIYLCGATTYGGGGIPTFVYWIYGSLFALFGLFAGNMFLQYKKVGKWKDYLYGERMYMVLSLAAKTALAWQIFAGTLRP